MNLRSRGQRRSGGRLGLVLLLLATACAGADVRVDWASGREVQRDLTSNVLTTGKLSAPSQAFLLRLGLEEEFRKNPGELLYQLHGGLEPGDGERIFTLAEASFLHAEKSGDRRWYLASAVYAWAFLLPDNALSPSPVDPRVRLALDLYNRGIAEGLATPDGREVLIAAGRHSLPFGVLEIDFDPAELRWAGYRFDRFTPAAHLEVKGLRNRYRRRGVGAPLAASITKDPDTSVPPGADRIPDFVKVPVTALLRLEKPQAGLESRLLHGRLELHARDETQVVTIRGQEIPLEFETSSSLAYGLGDSWFWDFQFAGFRSSDFLPVELEQAPDQLLMLQPYRPGRMPLVLVHGTASSPGTWAELINEVENDPVLWDRYQIWLFVYDTGSPILYSAGLLREALLDTVAALDPEGQDPALRRMVVIGHSQGGLLTKLAVVSDGDSFWQNVTRRPVEELDLPPETERLLKRSTRFEPVPSVERVVYIATPHRGTYLLSKLRIGGILSWMIKLPGSLVSYAVGLATRDPESDAVNRMRRLRGLPTSIDNMTPDHPTLIALENRPLPPGVTAHSIIAVRGSGPPEGRNDGVVEYSSAHVDGVESELVVRSGHSTQNEPNTIEEVRRILILHAGEAPPASSRVLLAPWPGAHVSQQE